MKQSHARILAVLFATVLIGVAMWRSRILLLPGQTATPTRGQALALDRERLLDVFESLNYMAANEIRDSGGVQPVLAPVLMRDLEELERGVGGSSRHFEEIVNDLSSLVECKFLDPSPQAYLDRVEKLGYKPFALDDVADAFLSYEEATGEPMPDDASPEQVYREILNDPRALASEQYRLRGMAVDPESIVAARGEYCAGYPNVWPGFRTGLGRDAWFGGRSGAPSRLFRGPGRDWFERARDGECVQTLAIGLVFSVGAEIKLPISFLYYYDEQTDRWWLGAVAPAYMPEDYGGIVI